MIAIEQYLTDEQDPKAAEKVLSKLGDLLNKDEELHYLAVQKKPAVNLLPDCIALTNKRLFYCEPTNFGITMKFRDISWKSIKEVSFKEELFGSKFICVPQSGENIVTDFIPKVQARKLYQATKEFLDAFNGRIDADRWDHVEEAVEVEPLAIEANEVQTQVIETPAYVTPVVEEEPEDETTLKLRKLKALFDKQLITQEEYEAKKANILDSF